jgi:pimeloyl-ACP methyl ester carboxylesterase
MTKPTLALLSGLLCDAALWSHQTAALGKTVDIVVPDLATHDTIAELARSVLAELPERFSLAGFSMGGYVALEIMRQAPTRVERLALLGTSARADTERQARRRRGLIALSGRGTFKGVTPRLLPRLLHPARLGDAALVEAIEGMAARVGRDGFLNQQRAVLGRVDSRALLPSIRCPALVLCGREDQMTPPDLSEEIAARVPGAGLVMLEKCGHLAPLERPGKTSEALLRWLCV